MDLLIKNARIVLPYGIFEGSVGVSNGKIAAITVDSNAPSADRVMNAGGKYLIPGVIDPHSHLRPGKGNAYESGLASEVESETGSAAAGGVTTFFTNFGQGQYPIPFERLTKIIDEKTIVDMSLHIGIGTMKHVEEIPEFVKNGVTSFKFMMNDDYATMFGLARADDGVIYAGLEAIKSIGHPTIALFHCENSELYRYFRERILNCGRRDSIAWSEAKSWVSEEEAIRRVSFFAKVIGARIYIPHLSIAQGVELLKQSRAEGLNVIVETCPHYLVLNCEEAKKVTSMINPPLRRKSDNAELWRGIRDGIIDCVGSDNVVASRKGRDIEDFFQAETPGFAGTETLLPIMLSKGVVEGRITLERLVEVCSSNTAKVFGLYPKKGCIAPDSDADLTLIDISKKRRVTPEILHTASDFNVYDGIELTGWPVLTIVRGTIVAEDGKIVGKPGTGIYLPRRMQAEGNPSASELLSN